MIKRLKQLEQFLKIKYKQARTNNVQNLNKSQKWYRTEEEKIIIQMRKNKQLT